MALTNTGTPISKSHKNLHWGGGGRVDVNTSTKVTCCHAIGVLVFCLKMFGFRNKNILLRDENGMFQKVTAHTL